MTTILLPPCDTEDSTNCFWDASHSGNGQGSSFWNYEGTTVFFDVPATATPVGVWLEIDDTDTYAEAPSWSVDFTWETVTETPSDNPDEITTTTTSTEQPGILAQTGLAGPEAAWIFAGGLALVIAGWWLLKGNQDRWRH